MLLPNYFLIVLLYVFNLQASSMEKEKQIKKKYFNVSLEEGQFLRRATVQRVRTTEEPSCFLTLWQLTSTVEVYGGSRIKKMNKTSPFKTKPTWKLHLSRCEWLRKSCRHLLTPLQSLANPKGCQTDSSTLLIVQYRLTWLQVVTT